MFCTYQICINVLTVLNVFGPHMMLKKKKKATIKMNTCQSIPYIYCEYAPGVIHDNYEVKVKKLQWQVSAIQIII